jgi:hypothetical protein
MLKTQEVHVTLSQVTSVKRESPVEKLWIEIPVKVEVLIAPYVRPKMKWVTVSPKELSEMIRLYRLFERAESEQHLIDFYRQRIEELEDCVILYRQASAE